MTAGLWRDPRASLLHRCWRSPAEILEKYVDATGHPPLLPDFALGFWQSKLRYRTQEELLKVTREYKDRGLPLAVVVSDYFHWHMMGDWAMDPRDWPDPAGMVKALKELGVELMVSVWPTVNPTNPVYREMAERGLLERSTASRPISITIRPRGFDGCFYDATNPDARLLGAGEELSRCGTRLLAGCR
jgi:alpha-D-xyloside xylohydrolase